MSEPVSALQGASYEGLVSIRDAGATGMITVRGDLSSPLITQTLSDATGCAMPDTRGVEGEVGRGLLWMSPDEAMLLCGYGETDDMLMALTETLAGEHVLFADVSDARALLTLDGPGLRDVLAKVTPADMHPERLSIGELRRTRLSQVAAAFWLETETRAHLICFRSVADYVFALLSTAAHPDSRVGYFA